jgi:hypothetical protein
LTFDLSNSSTSTSCVSEFAKRRSGAKRALIRGHPAHRRKQKLAELLGAQTPTRMDYQLKYDEIISEYNK